MSEAFINGFLKRAADYGVSENDAIELLQKQAIIGPLGEVATGMLPSYIGAALGRFGPMGEDAAEKQRTTGYSLGKAMFIPGYTGYHLGRNSKSKAMLIASKNKERKEERKKKKELKAEEKKKNL
jgi:hypothetical protein